MMSQSQQCQPQPFLAANSDESPISKGSLDEFIVKIMSVALCRKCDTDLGGSRLYCRFLRRDSLEKSDNVCKSWIS